MKWRIVWGENLPKLKHWLDLSAVGLKLLLLTIKYCWIAGCVGVLLALHSLHTWPIWRRECGLESRSGSKRKSLTVREQISNNIRQRLGIQRSPVCSLSAAPFSLSLVSVLPLFSRDCEVTSWLGFSPFLPQICLHAFEKNVLAFSIKRRIRSWNGFSQDRALNFLMTHTSLWCSEVHLVTVSAHVLNMSVVWDEFGVKLPVEAVTKSLVCGPDRR